MPTDPSKASVGIHDLTFATTSLCLTHEELARHTGAPWPSTTTASGRRP